MFANYLKIALRNLLRHKGYSIINIAGLAIGMAACLLIVLYIQRELSFENMNPKADRIYRVLTIDKALGTNNQRVGITMPALGPAVPPAFPDVEASLRVTGSAKTLLTYGDRPSVYAENLRMADSNFFDFFNFPMLQGDPATALKEPFALVLTAKLARQIFGEEDALGKTIKTGNGNDVKVTGVLKDLPDNIHFDFDALGSIATLKSLLNANRPPNSTRPIWIEQWQLIAMPTYLMFREGSSVSGYDQKLTKFCRENGVGENFEITLQPLLGAHLRSKDVIMDYVANKGDVNNVYTFAAIAVLILLIAVINYMNLSTARGAERAKEVGIRKVVGSLRSQLIVQFLGESLLITLVALLLAEPLAYTTLPWLNGLIGAHLTFNLAHNALLLACVILLLFIVGIVSGLYPAFVLTGFKPVTVLKGSFKTGQKGTKLRKGLVVFQFALSIALITMAAVIQRQIYYVQHKDLGYNRDQVLVFDMFDRSMGANLATFREELSKQSSFVSLAEGFDVPGRGFGRTRVRPEGVADENIWIWSSMTVSPEVLPTLGMEIAQGRNFNREMATDTNGVVLINETAARALGWENPLSKRLYFGQSDSIGTQVIGVVKDFHFTALHQKIEPVVIFPLGNTPGGLLMARIQGGRIAEALESAQQKWKEIFPGHPFSYSFLDDEFNATYRQDINTGKIVNTFTILAIFIACLGLFGLASYSTAQRNKEIGVRKVMGASIGTIVRLLVLDFLRWVVIANLIAWPLALYIASKWLDGFAYRTTLSVWSFLAAGTMALFIALITVSFQAVNAATTNPVKSLRYE
ncbi:MAG: ABC transporter permease [bacterium]|nr:ABC transporter permease [bacterium]